MINSKKEKCEQLNDDEYTETVMLKPQQGHNDTSVRLLKKRKKSITPL